MKADARRGIDLDLAPGSIHHRMKSFVIDQWLRIRSSYWFVPLFLVTAAVAAAFTAVWIDSRIDVAQVRGLSWLYIAEPGAARAILATIAGSMITVAGVTFSLTLLAVSHASTQLGPRIIVEIMSDRGNQVTLGVFTSTFLYGLVVLRTVTDTTPDGGNAFVPYLAILLGLILAVASVLVLVYFIHHVPETLNVSKILDGISRDAVRRVSDLYPEPIGEEAADPPVGVPADLPSTSRTLRFPGDGGYVRVIDGAGIVASARNHDAVLELLVQPGDFVVNGAEFARVHTNDAEGLDTEALADALCSDISCGSERSKEQDPAFPIEQICEIAGRALSPGINDPFTALRCIDHLERVMSHLATRPEPSTRREDDEGELRVITKADSHVRLAERMLVPMSQYSRGDAMVTKALVRMCTAVADRASHAPLERFLRAQAAELADEQRLAAADQRLGRRLPIQPRR